jgi:hypothetical protein
VVVFFLHSIVYETGLHYADKHSRSLSKRDLLCYVKAESNPVPLRCGDVFPIWFPSTTDTDRCLKAEVAVTKMIVMGVGLNRISRSHVDRSFLTFGF